MTGVWPPPSNASRRWASPNSAVAESQSQSKSIDIALLLPTQGTPQVKDEYCRAASDDTVRSVDETSSSGSRDPREVRHKAGVDRIVLALMILRSCWATAARMWTVRKTPPEFCAFCINFPTPFSRTENAACPANDFR
jgi:hypothetical protein